MMTSKVIKATFELVKDEMKDKDGSHDIHHVERVVKHALAIAKREQVADLELITLAALLHDIRDWKYYKNQFHRNLDFIRIFLHKYLRNGTTDRDRIEHIIYIINNIGFSSEIKQSNPIDMSLEFKIVQDADRLDAIGAIGIARCFTYGGVINNALYTSDCTMSAGGMDFIVKDAKGGSINHFHDKLFKLKDMMKTQTGKEMAIERHNFMKVFEAKFFDEMNI